MGGFTGVEGFESPPNGGFRGWLLWEFMVKKSEVLVRNSLSQKTRYEKL